VAKAFRTWTVLPHKPIEKIAENLWRVEGRMPRGDTRRQAVLARMKDGRVVVHNAIALDDAEMKELEAWGKPAAIVVPNRFHRQDAFIFKERYRDARVVAPKGAHASVAAVVRVDDDYADAPSDETVRMYHLRGLADREGVIEVHSADGVTLVFNDAVMNMPKLGGIPGMMLAPTGRPAVPRAMRWLMIRDARAFADHLDELAAIPKLTRVVVAHGRPITQDPASVLRSLAAELR
jgi:hypothetical protein